MSANATNWLLYKTDVYFLAILESKTEVFVSSKALFVFSDLGL